MLFTILFKVKKNNTFLYIIYNTIKVVIMNLKKNKIKKNKKYKKIIIKNNKKIKSKKIKKKIKIAKCEVRTHDLKIMRLTRCRLRQLRFVIFCKRYVF